MEKVTTSSLDDLRASPSWVAIALTIFGLMLGIYVSIHPQMSVQSKIFVVLLLVIGSLGWLTSGWNPLFSGFFLVIALSAMTFLAGAWFQIPGTMTLLSIPIWLAVALISWQAGFGAALVNTCLVFLLSLQGILQLELTSIWLTVVSIWSAMGMVMAVQIPIRRVSVWTSEYYESTRTRLVEAQDRQVKLSQALDDLMHANGQLALLNERIGNYRQAAEEARRSKEMFVARVSHEFRAPLNIIIGMVSLMVDSAQAYDSPLPALAMQQLEVIDRSCRHLASMINDVLDLSQSEGGRLILHKEPVNLIEVVDSALAIVRPLINSKGLSLLVNYPNEMPLINCDRLRIRQVILNLLSNAARYTEKGAITLDIRLESENVLLSISDTGPGIAPEDARRVFEPFSQVGKDTRRMHGGSGLGLSISKQFVELHDGMIGLESQPGQGSRFWIKLPLDSPAQPAAQPGQWISDHWIWVERHPSGERPAMVLKPKIIVCDETGILYSTFLHSREDYELVDTRELQQALDELQKAPVSSLVMNLPHVGDLDNVLARLRKEAPETPVVCSSFPRRIDEAKQAGADGFILKPLTSLALDQVLDSLECEFNCILVVDDDKDTREMMRDLIHLYKRDIEVMLAEDGESALRLMRDACPDLVFLDVVMPGMSGWEVLAQKQQDETIQETPVIMVSGQDMQTGAANSPFLIASIGDGVSTSKLIECLPYLSKLMLNPG